MSDKRSNRSTPEIEAKLEELTGDNECMDRVLHQMELMVISDISGGAPRITHVFVEGEREVIDILSALSVAQMRVLWNAIYASCGD